MKIFSIEKEYSILRAILKRGVDKWYCGNGAARIVLNVDDELRKICGLSKKNYPEDMVLKIAMGEAGYCQTRAEIDAYENSSDDVSYHLASIIAHGIFIEVMEKIDTSLTDAFSNYIDDYDEEGLWCDLNGLDVSDFLIDNDYYEYDYDLMDKKDKEGSTRFTRTRASELAGIVQFLNEYFGTTDVFQVGFNKYGDLVCFDYGIPYDCDFEVCCASSREFSDNPNQYLQVLCDTIAVFRKRDKVKKLNSRKASSKVETEAYYSLGLKLI